MNEGFLISGNSLLWTNRGILKLSEVKKGDSLLGLDRLGKISRETLSDDPILVDKNGSVLRLFSDKSEIVISGDTKVCTLEGPKKGKNLKKDDKIEIIAYRDKLFDLLNQERSIEVELDGRNIPITTSLAFLFGMIARRLFYEKKRLIIRVPPGKKNLSVILESALEAILPFVDEARFKTFEYIPGEIWSWFVIDSPNIFNFIEEFQSKYGLIPLCFRKNLDLCCSFVEGFLKVGGEIEKNKFIIKTDLEEYWIREFLFCILYIRGIKCKSYPSPIYQPHTVTLQVSKDIFKKMEEKKRSFLKSISIVRAISKRKEDIYYLPYLKEKWDPIVQLAILYH